MNSQVVVVKDFVGRLLVRCVHHASQSFVFVTSKSALERIKNGDPELIPIGFPVEDVFIYEGEPDEANLDVRKLRPWTGVQTLGK